MMEHEDSVVIRAFRQWLEELHQILNEHEVDHPAAQDAWRMFDAGYSPRGAAVVLALHRLDVERERQAEGVGAA